MLLGPGSKNTAPPVALWECTPSMMTAGGSSSKQQPATNSAALSCSTCAAMLRDFTAWSWQAAPAPAPDIRGGIKAYPGTSMGS